MYSISHSRLGSSDMGYTRDMPSAALTRYKATLALPGIPYGSEPTLDPDDPKVKKWVKNKFLVPLEVVRKVEVIVWEEPAPGSAPAYIPKPDDHPTLAFEREGTEAFIPKPKKKSSDKPSDTPDDDEPTLTKNASNQSSGSVPSADDLGFLGAAQDS